MILLKKVFLVFLNFLWIYLSVSLTALEGSTLQTGVVKIRVEVQGSPKIGTGFIVQRTWDNIYIVTASHVVDGDKNPEVEFFNQRDMPVTSKVVALEGGDPKGLALLLVRRELDNIPPGLSTLTLAPSVNLESDIDVLIMGYSRMVGSLSSIKGSIVSRIGRNIFFSGDIVEGNSGSPMIKEDHVVGLVLTKSKGRNAPYGSAIPSSSVISFLEGYIKIKPIKPTPKPNNKSVDGVDFSMILKNLNEETQKLVNEIKDTYLKYMDNDKGDIFKPVEKKQMWQDFLNNYPNDYIKSREYQKMRNNANNRFQYWREFTPPSVILRSSYKNVLGVQELQSISNFKPINEEWGEGYGYSKINHDYKEKKIKGDVIVVDYTTGLMWHKSGSREILTWEEAKDWVDKLNYSGYSDWRLPTVEEAVSLLESNKKNGDLNIDEIFDEKQRNIWTGDSFRRYRSHDNYRYTTSEAWQVFFGSFSGCGFVQYNDVTYKTGVRPVRSKEIPEAP